MAQEKTGKISCHGVGGGAGSSDTPRRVTLIRIGEETEGEPQAAFPVSHGEICAGNSGMGVQGKVHENT